MSEECCVRPLKWPLKPMKSNCFYQGDYRLVYTIIIYMPESRPCYDVNRGSLRYVFSAGSPDNAFCRLEKGHLTLSQVQNTTKQNCSMLHTYLYLCMVYSLSLNLKRSVAMFGREKVCSQPMDYQPVNSFS